MSDHYHHDYAGFDEAEPVYNEPVPVPFDDRLLTADEVAGLLVVPRSSVYEYARREHDALPAVRVGRHLRFVRDDVDAWIVAQRVVGTARRHRHR